MLFKGRGALVLILGQELASMDADGAWTKRNISSQIPGLVGPRWP